MAPKPPRKDGAGKGGPKKGLPKKRVAKKRVAKKRAPQELVAQDGEQREGGPRENGPRENGPRESGPKQSGLKKRAPKKGLAKKRLAQHIRQDDAVVASGGEVLDRLHATIMARRSADPAVSHSARLLSRGVAKVAQKFGEEAVECVIEAVAGQPEAMVAESADVLYHLVVMWVAAGVAPERVWAELTRREGVSGIAEKAARVRPALGTTKIP